MHISIGNCTAELRIKIQNLNCSSHKTVVDVTFPHLNKLPKQFMILFLEIRNIQTDMEHKKDIPAIYLIYNDLYPVLADIRNIGEKSH